MTKPVLIEVDVRKRDVALVDNKEGVTKNYTIKEMSGSQKEEYLNSLRQKSRVADNGDIIVENYKGMFTDLLCCCMYNEEDELVQRGELTNMPARVLTDLSQIAKQLNGLTLQDAQRMMDEAKND